ncbi:50S ribosomal protein L11 methyltransferase [Halomonas chromatireducens]|uniref:Ribosomal protein L11 methyltransferase n=1 Tax=Halomonas chromatireducens TaxID=507626 RepID=A0A109ULC2_9GAMM|nr:50S ribosomal protein L11 methyltransferase [Halomonas chromatireducens]AMD00291.1 Ribosomal protein L11 methyltransferase [Halomonas chromatireducens]
MQRNQLADAGIGLGETLGQVVALHGPTGNADQGRRLVLNELRLRALDLHDDPALEVLDLRGCGRQHYLHLQLDRLPHLREIYLPCLAEGAILHLFNLDVPASLTVHGRVREIDADWQKGTLRLTHRQRSWEGVQLLGHDAKPDDLVDPPLAFPLNVVLSSELLQAATMDGALCLSGQGEWMDGFQPLRMGQRLWIVPSWHQPPDPDAVNLHLDPGLAFGTGTHPTTALCLEWLDGLSLTGELDERAVLDIGCGSGILAIAALKLGAGQAIGTDIDPQALQASRDNAARNAIADEDLRLCYPEELAESGTATTFPVVIANILAGPLIDMAATVAGHVAPAGRLVLSGILESQAGEVLEAYREQGLVMDEPEIREGWVRLSGQRPI